MKTNMTRHRSQVYSIGNYLMTGKVFGKGHFAKVEEATHRIIGKKVAIKIIDVTNIKEEYARRNLHREPRVMAKLRHPCIAALYETMMHGPRLYVVMEAASGGDLCALVLAARGHNGGVGGLSETRARPLAQQLVSAVRHMHAKGVVHRDLKMENIMLDNTKQFIKIVDFGLSNLWSAGGALRTPCGSLEYAAPELFVDGRRYGPEVDLWSIGVIVYGMVTGGLPFNGAEGATGGKGSESRSRSRLRAAIARGFTHKQRATLACVSAECKTFIQQLLEPKVELRMKIEEAARHRWVKKAGMRMRTHPLTSLEPKHNREIYRQISELSGQTVMDVVAQIKADPFGPVGGMYNIKTHLHQLQATPGGDLLWSSVQELRPVSPPEYRPQCDGDNSVNHSSKSSPPLCSSPQKVQVISGPLQKMRLQDATSKSPQSDNSHRFQIPNSLKSSDVVNRNQTSTVKTVSSASQISRDTTTPNQSKHPTEYLKRNEVIRTRSQPLQNSRFLGTNRPLNVFGLKKPSYKIYDSGDYLDPRLPSIEEHSNTNVVDAKKEKTTGTSYVRKISLEGDRSIRLNSCPNKGGDSKKLDYYSKTRDGLPGWKTTGVTSSAARILLQTNATTIKRASLGNIVSPHSSSNSHCKSERAMPVGWYSRSTVSKDNTHVHRLRRTAPMK